MHCYTSKATSSFLDYTSRKILHMGKRNAVMAQFNITHSEKRKARRKDPDYTPGNGMKSG
jgi:hypothetical protein